MVKKIGKNLIIFLVILGFISIGAFTVYYLITGIDDGNGGNGADPFVITPTTVDLSFDEWTYDNILLGKRYIIDKDDYIEISNDVYTWGTICSAGLNFGVSTEVNWKFRMKNIDTGSQQSSAKFYVRSGDDYLIRICGLYYTGKIMLYVRGIGGIVLLSANDQAWHDIEVYCKITDGKVDIIVKFDGVIKYEIDAYDCGMETLDNLYYTSAQYYTTYGKTFTHLVLNSLVVS